MKTNLTLFDKLMIAITFAEAYEATPVIKTDTTKNISRSCKTLPGKDNNDATLSHGLLGTKAQA